MQDTALTLIQPHLMQSDKTILWVIDENIAALPTTLPSPSLTALTNRYDIYQEANHKKINTHFNDFDSTHFRPNHFDLIVYRVSKERVVVHHVINQSFPSLKEGGQLILCGQKQEGIKTHIKNAEKRFNQKASFKLEKQFRIATLMKDETGGTLLDDNSYSTLRQIPGSDTHSFTTKPGLFGWNKVDAGSEFLALNLKSMFDNSRLTSGSLLDLGCGYGYLSIMANDLGNFEITATDNNAAAVATCQQNFQSHKINGQVLATDCGMGINQKFDGIICNPPFHGGFQTSEALTEKFLIQIHFLLKKGCSAFLVCNQFLAIEKKASALFSKVDSSHRNKSFKLISLQK
ncbi:MAG: methyltransferase [Pseudomonadales bacterium]|nr:methyltransferase [Pseudomonadales bacterium]